MLDLVRRRRALRPPAPLPEAPAIEAAPPRRPSVLARVRDFFTPTGPEPEEMAAAEAQRQMELATGPESEANMEAARAVAGDVARGVRDFFTPTPRPEPQSLAELAPALSTATREPTLSTKPQPSIRAATPTPAAELPVREFYRPLAPSYADIAGQQIEERQRELQQMSLPRRLLEAGGAGARRMVDIGTRTVGLPEVPSARLSERQQEAVKSGAGLTEPLQEGPARRLLADFVEFIPEVAALEASGALKLGELAFQPARQALFRALAPAIGDREALAFIRQAALEDLAAVERTMGPGAGEALFKPALGEQVAERLASAAEFGIGLGGFEAAVGHGAGLSPAERLRVFGEEAVGGAAAGLGFEAAGALAGGLAGRAGRAGIEALRAGRRAGGASMAEIRRGRAEAQREAAFEPVIQRTVDLMVRAPAKQSDLGLTRALLRDFPTLSDAEATLAVRRARERLSMTGATGPVPAPVAERPRPATAAPKQPTVDEQADLLRKIAAAEVQTARIRREGATDDQLLALQQGTDELVNRALSVGDRDVAARASTVSAQVAELLQTPAEARIPKPAAPPAPEAPPPPKREIPRAAERRARERGETITPIGERGYEVGGARATPPAPTEPSVTEFAHPSLPPRVPEPVPAPAAAGPSRRLAPETRRAIEDEFPEAKGLSDEELIGEFESQGVKLPVLEPTPAAPERLRPKETRKQPTFEEVVAKRPAFEGATGPTEDLLVHTPEGRTEKRRVQYRIVDVDELAESHVIKGGRAEPNPEFPGEVQPRAKMDPARIAEIATEGVFDPDQLLTASKTAELGPPITIPQGVVLGGNHRTGILRRVLDENGPAAERYREALRERAEDLGLDPESVGPRSVLVRELEKPPATGAEARRLADDLNRTAIAARSVEEDAVLASERVSPETLRHLEETFPDEGTMRQYVETADGAEFVRRLREDAAIPKELEKRLVTAEGALTNEGRDFVESMMVGRAVGDAGALAQAPLAVRAKLIKAAPMVAGLQGDFDLRAVVREALRILGEAQRGGVPAKAFIEQQGLGLGEGGFSATGKQLAYFLDKSKQREVADAFRLFRSVQRAKPEGQEELIPGEAVGPITAFRRAFGGEFVPAPRTTMEMASEGELFPPEALRPTQGQAQALAQQRLERLREELRVARPDQRQAIAQQMVDLFPVARGGGAITPEEMSVRAIAAGKTEVPQERGQTEMFAGELPEEPPAPRLRLDPDRLKRLGQKLGVEIAPEVRGKLGEALRRRAQEKGAQGAEATPAPQPQGGRPGVRAGGGPTPAGGRPGGPRPGVGERKPVTKAERDKARRQRDAAERRAERERLLDEERQRLQDAQGTADQLVDVRQVPDEIRADLHDAGRQAGLDPKMVDDQVRDVARVRQAFERTGPDATGGFLVANAPGTGKTFIALGVAKTMRMAKADPESFRALILIDNTPLAQQWQRVADEAFGTKLELFKEGAGPGVYTMSYAKLGETFQRAADWGKFDLVIFDESHKIQNIRSAKRAIAAEDLIYQAADKTLYLSATPYEYPWDMEYLKGLRLWGQGRRDRSFEAFLSRHGMSMDKRGRWYFTDATREGIVRRLIQIRRELMEAGVYSQRAARFDQKLQNRFVEVPFADPYAGFYQQVQRTLDALEGRVSGGMKALVRSFKVTFTRRISELAKIPRAVELAKQLREQGKSVVVFVGYKMNFELAPQTARKLPELAAVMNSLDEQYRRGMHRLVEDLGGSDVVAQVHGLISASRRVDEIAKFQGGEKRLMVATVDAGGTGLSLHDTLGNLPRAQVNLTAPWTGKGMEQLAGRTYRAGGKSDVEMYWLGIDTPIERELLNRVAMKMTSMGALVEGQVKENAIKLAEFDFLPESEIQRQLHDFDRTAIQEPGSELGFARPPRRRVTIGDVAAELDDAVRKLEVDLAAQVGVAKGSTPPPKTAAQDLELPVHSRDIVKPSQIISRIARRFAFRAFLQPGMRGGKLGLFQKVSEAVKLRFAQNVGVAVHEFVHGLDKRYFGFFEHPKRPGAPMPAHLQRFALELRDLAYPGAKEPVAEGFAEFGRYYVQKGPAWLRKKAPAFTRYFLDHMARTAPKDLEALDWAHEQWRLYQEQPALAKIGSRVAIGDDGEPVLRPARWWRRFYATVLDHQLPFRDIDRMMVAEDPNWRSLQKLGRLVYGADFAAENMLQKGVIDWRAFDEGNRVVRRSKGLGQAFKRLERRDLMDAWIYWSVARRAKELAGAGKRSGLEDLLADGTVDEVIRWGEQHPDVRQLFEETWTDFKGIEDGLLKFVDDAGLIDADLRPLLQKLYEYHVPFYRVLGEPDHLNDWIANVGRSGRTIEGMVAQPPAIFQQRGSTRPIINPLESLIGNVRYFTQLAYRHRVEQQLAKFADQAFGAEGHADYMIRVDPPMVASRYRVAEIRRALGNLGIELKDVSDEQLQQLVTLFHPTPRSKLQERGMFSVRIRRPDGTMHRQWYQVNDLELWQAAAGLQPLDWSLLGRLALRAKTVLRSGVVLSPQFIIRNFIRDSQTAWIQGTDTMIPLVDSVRGLAEMIQAGDLYDEFVLSGAAGASLANITRKANQDYLRNLLGHKALSRHLSANHGLLDNTLEVGRFLADGGKGFLDGLNHAASIVENANRLAAFRARRARGASLVDAGFEGREVSTDFALHGARMRGWTLLTAFLNPSVQGAARFARQIKQRPLMTAMRAIPLMATSAGLWWANRNDPDFPEISEDLKQRYWLIRDPWSKLIWRVPKAYGYGDLFGSFLAEAFLDWAYDRDPDIVGRLGNALEMGFGMPLVPTLALPALEVALNKSLYFDRPIVSRGLEEALPVELRATEFTSAASQVLAQQLERLAQSADRDYGVSSRVGRIIRAMKLAPAQYDHLVRGYFGTLGYDLWRSALDRPAKAIAKKNGYVVTGSPINQGFFLRDFTVAFPTSSAQSLRAFYDLREVMADIAQRYAALQKVDPDEALRYYVQYRDELDAWPLIESVAAKLTQDRKDLAAAETEEAWNAIQRSSIEAAKEMVDLWGQLTPAQREILHARQEERTTERMGRFDLDEARARIQSLVIRRQLKGLVDPTPEEEDAVFGVIDALDLTGTDRRNLIDYYRRIRRGDLIEREAGKSSRRARRQALPVEEALTAGRR